MSKHWSFIFCSKPFILTLALLFLIGGVAFSHASQNGHYINDSGMLITILGSFASMRGIFRNGLSRYQSATEDQPVINGNQLNAEYFNKRVFQRGDAVIQIYGFILIIAGSILSVCGDKLYKLIF